MTNGYVKLFSTILASSVWCQDDKTRLVWITMLVLMDTDGNVKSTIPGLAHLARVDVEACRKAVALFLAPDPDSATKEHEGRRISEIDGGWHILNSAKYKEMMSLEQRREYWRGKKAEARAKYSKATKGMTLREIARRNQEARDKLNA